MDLHTLIIASMAVTGAVSAVGTFWGFVTARAQKPSAVVARVMVLFVCIGGVSYMLLTPAKSESQPSTVSAPLSAEAHYQKAKQYYDDRNRPQATKEARQAVVLEPTHKDAHKLLGACYGMDQNMSAAASEYKEAVQIDPDDTEASLALAVCLDALGSRAEAKKAYGYVARHPQSTANQRQRAHDGLQALGG